MATKQELHEIRKALNEAEVSVVAQLELLHNAFYYYEAKSPYNNDDLELEFSKEALSAWKTGKYNLDNVKKMIAHNDIVITSIFDRMSLLKKSGKEVNDWLPDAFIKGNRGLGVLKKWEEERQTLEKELETTKTELKTWTDNFGTLKPSEIKQCTHKPTDLKPADYDKTNEYWEQEFGNIDLNPLVTLDGLKKVREKLTELETQSSANDKYAKELLTLKQTEVENRLHRFATEIYLDKDDIVQEFGDLKQVVKENVSLVNTHNEEIILKALILILAPYKAQSKNYNKSKILAISKKYNEISVDKLDPGDKLFTKYSDKLNKFRESKRLIEELKSK